MEKRDRTKTKIVEAFLQLFLQKKYADITIERICEKADLSRRTFYRYFHSKEVLLDYYIDLLFEKYYKQITKIPQMSLDNIAQTYFGFCLDNLIFLQILIDNQLELFLLSKFNQYMVKIQLYFQLELESNEYINSFKVGGLWNLMIIWVKNGAIETPREMALLLKDIVIKKT